MTSGRFWVVRVSSSACSRTMPSVVRWTCLERGSVEGVVGIAPAGGALRVGTGRGVALVDLAAAGFARDGPVAGSPRAPSASPSATWTMCVGGRGASTGSGMQGAGDAGPRPLAGRAPQVRERQDHARVGQPREVAVGDALGERGEQRVLVFLDGRRGRPPHAGRVEGPEGVQPVARRVGSSIAERRLGHGRELRRDRRVARPDVQDRPRRQPERRQPSGEFLGGRAVTVEQERLDTLDPLADPGQLQRRGRQGSGEFDHEDAGPACRQCTAPDDRSIGQQAHGPEQSRSAGVVGHPGMVPGITPRRIARRRAASSARRR